MSALRVTSTDAEVQDISSDIRSAMPGLVFTTGIDPAYVNYSGYAQPGQGFNSIFIAGVAVVSIGQLVGMRDDAKAKGPYTWIMGAGGFPIPFSLAPSAPAAPTHSVGGPLPGPDKTVFGASIPAAGSVSDMCDQIASLAAQIKGKVAQ